MGSFFDVTNMLCISFKSLFSVVIKIGYTYKKNNSFIMGALTQIRAFKQFEGALHKIQNSQKIKTKEIQNLGGKH